MINLFLSPSTNLFQIQGFPEKMLILERFDLNLKEKIFLEHPERSRKMQL